MDYRYRVNVCRHQLADNEIPLLERVIEKYLGLSGPGFYQAFDNSESLSFEGVLDVDCAQECVFVLEEQGFKVVVDKLGTPIPAKDERVFTNGLAVATGVESLTDDDCQVLFSGYGSGSNWLTRHSGSITFACCTFVASAYFLMIYSSI